MCGITGLISGENNREKVIHDMTRAIFHRGPDEDGYLLTDKLALGMKRLSIIDLAGGTQPIYSLDKRLAIFFNGEIYNYKELKKKLVDKGYTFETDSDTEVTLRMYEVFGPEMLTELRGMFAFSIYDSISEKIFIARDFFGIKPLYYHLVNGKVRAFGSEMKSFLEIPGFERVVNDEAVYNYLSYQYNPLSEAFLKGVYKLPPGHYMEVEADGTYKVEEYYKFEFNPRENLDEGETREKIRKTMEDSVSHHMIADVPVGSFLSGGIDSSIIATLMQKVRGEKKIKTFTVGFDTLSEGKEAKETAEPLGTDHREITIGPDRYFSVLPKAIWHFDEPVADPSAIGLYFLAEEARKHVKVVLSGEGSDELFGGYNIYLEPYARRRISWIPKFILKILSKLPLRGSNFASRASQKLEDRYIGNASIFMREEVNKIWKGEKFEPYSLHNLYTEVGNVSDSVKMQYIDINTWLVGDILQKADKMTMSHSLELRVPFLDREVGELASTLPDRFKWRGRITKYLLREAFRNVLPESVRNRRKLGFPTPIRTWLTKERKDLYDVILKNPYIESHFDTEYISLLISEHTERQKDNSRKIYVLLALALWYNAFIDTQ